MLDRKKETETLKISLPDGVTAQYEGTFVTVKGEKGELVRELFHPRVKIEVKDGAVSLTSRKYEKKDKRMCHTYHAHINNMIQGVQEPFTYQLKACSGHFPMTLKVEGNKIIITNFLGEKVPRSSKIMEGVTVNISGDQVTVEGIDLEKTGQTAANLEKATKIKGRDRRIFQDGCFITSKPE